MDEIQDCIANAQYAETLRERDSTKPNRGIQSPPKDFDPHEFARKHNFDLKYACMQPVGVYILSKHSPANKSVFKFLYELEEFKRKENPELDLYRALLKKAQRLPSRYKTVVDDISLRVNTNVLPSLKSTPSMGRLLDAEKGEEVDVDTIELEDKSGQDAENGGDKKNEDEAEKAAEKKINARRLSLVRQREDNKRSMMVHFNKLEETLISDNQGLWSSFTESEDFVRMAKVLWYCEQPITLDSFNIFRDLGRGAFGVVSGARFRSTGTLLALKCMNRKLVKGKKALKLVKAEREVLARLGDNPSPFTIYLKYSWCDRDTLYLALPLCTGGDLCYHLQEQRFSASLAKFYIAETVLGIAHLHSMGILYRDLKPENILLDEEGHCRISDMGLAVITNGKPLRGRAGTPGYWSPEMISKKRYSYPTDWWSLGCVAYELLAGRCPFSKINTKMERDDATLTWHIEFPERLANGNEAFPEDAKAFILKLLTRDKTKRLGSGERGAEDVKDDPYFRDIQFDRLNRLEIPPSWKPRKEGIHAYNQSEIDNKSNEHDYRKIKLEAEDNIPDFDYTSRISHQEDIVQVLKLQDEGKIGNLDKTDAMGCCTLL